MFMDRYNTAPGKTALGDAITGFSAFAHRGPMKDTFIRVAKHEDIIYIDLGNDEHDAIKVTSEGWEIVAEAPVPLIRSGSMQAMRYPERGGSIAELREFVNVASDDDFKLLVGALVTYLVPGGPYLILNPRGQSGAAKTTLSKVIRKLIDPNKLGVAAPPKDLKDLKAIVAASHLIALDNLSYVSEAMADAYCRLATGAALSDRALYTDMDSAVLDACRPIVMNGITDLSSRPDFLPDFSL